MNITGGKYNGRKIQAPPESIVRPTLSKVRMSVFNTLYSLLGDFENLSFLDMFGGSGIMGLEALSRGFKDVVVFEKNRKVAEILRANYKILDIEPKLFIGDSINLYKKINKTFDVIYVDPPYMSDAYQKCLEIISDAKIIVLEHTTEINTDKFTVIKQKKYGDKYLTFLKGNL